MKRLTHKYKKYLLLKSKYSLRKRTKSKNTRQNTHNSKRKLRKPPANRIYAPHNFCIELVEFRDELLDFLEELRRVFPTCVGETLVIDFSRTQRFFSTGTTLFYAELTRLMELTSFKVKLRCTSPANERANQVLEQIGVYRLCNHPSHGQPFMDDVVHWRVARGHVVDNSLCAPAIEEYEGQLATPLSQRYSRWLG